MIELMHFEADYYSESERKKTMLYGCGTCAKEIFPFVRNVTYICDAKARQEELFFHGIRVISPEELNQISESIIIILCAMKKQAREEMLSVLYNTMIDAKVFDMYNSSSFNTFKRIEKKNESHALKRIRLVGSDSWILGKFAKRMEEELLKRGYDVDINDIADVNADINHHLSHTIYEPIKAVRDTIMLTHFNSINQVEQLKLQLKTAEMGICMSRDTLNQLVGMGVDRYKLCYINPAHDGVIKPRKYILGITHRCYDRKDNRRRDTSVLDICKEIDPVYFEFRIMGSGWEEIVDQMRERGFTVIYYNDFDYDIYTELMPQLDYYLFQGFDEGSMGFLDAIAAGVETIVTPQGFHLDVKNGITHACRTVDDVVDVLKRLEYKKRTRVKSVETWTWSNYVDKHIEVWNYILGNYDGLFDKQHLYEDGIYSVFREEQ